MSLKIRIYPHSIMNYITMIVLILSGGGFVMDLGAARGYIIGAITALQIVWFVLHVKPILKSQWIAYTVLMLYLGVHFVVFLGARINIATYLFYFFELTATFLLIIGESKRNLIYTYNKCIAVVCIYSLIIYFLNFAFDFSRRAVPLGNTYKLFLGCNIRYMTRNAGPFWEPGIFQIYVCFALAFVLFIKEYFSKKEQLFYSIIYFVTVLTTLSTTGYIVATFLLGVKFVLLYKEISGKFRALVFFIAPIVLAAMGYILFNSNVVQSKFFSGHISLKMRQTDISQIIPIIRESGLFGFGAGSYARQQMLIQHHIASMGLGNSVAINAAVSSYGLAYFILIVVGVVKNIHQSFDRRFIFYILFVITLFTEPLFSIPLYMMFYLGFCEE